MAPDPRAAAAARLRGVAWALAAIFMGLLLAWPARAQVSDGLAPRLELMAGESLVLTDLPPVLGDDEVRRHLGTGLTTSFDFRVRLRAPDGAEVLGFALVEVRYEPWDEVYVLAARGLDGKLVRDLVPTFEVLLEKWRALRLGLLRPRDAEALGRRPPPGELRVELKVIPFSAGEQDDTRRWFSESLDRSSRGGTENVAKSSEDRSEALAEVFSLLMATSIQRTALVSYRWPVPVSAGAPKR
ncbi:MAG: hypothetical protein AAGN66_08910 [Acidobacteriota bacterium]